jgi:photosystem II stability/assembly factor-like uncharacterized protein
MLKDFPKYFSRILLIAGLCFCASNTRAQQWEQIGWQGGNIGIAIQFKNNLYGLSGNGLYKSTNWGKTWSLFRNGLPINNEIYQGGKFSNDKSFLYFIPYKYTDSGLYFSKETDSQWYFKPFLKIDGQYTFTAFPNDSTIGFIVNSDGRIDSVHGLFLSLDSGKSWRRQMEGLPKNTLSMALTYSDDYIFAECLYDSLQSGFFNVYRSKDRGTHWEKIMMPHGDTTSQYRITSLPGKVLFASSESWTNIFFKTLNFYRSSDYGNTWVEIISPFSERNDYLNVGAPYKIGSKVFLSIGSTPDVDKNIIYISNDNALHWSLLDSIEYSKDFFGTDNNYVFSIYSPNLNGNFTTDSTFRFWDTLPSLGAFNNYGHLQCVKNTKLFATGNTTYYPENWFDSIIISTDNGSSWSSYLLPNQIKIYNEKWLVDANKIFAAGVQIDSIPCIFQTSDDAQTWEIYAKLPSKDYVIQFYIEGDTIVVGRENDMIVSIDKGHSWIVEQTPQYFSYHNGITLGLFHGIIETSKNFGSTWQKENFHVNTDNNLKTGLAVFSNSWFVSDPESQTYYKGIKDTVWKKCKGFSPNLFCLPMASENGILFATGSLNGYPKNNEDHSNLYYSFDQGSSWRQLGGYVTNSTDVFIGSEYIFLAGPTELWRMPKSVLASLKAPEVKKISSLSMSCFPNPASTSTRISYSITQRSNILLQAFDVMGREITRIAGGSEEAGSYEIVWDTKSLPSGSYLIRLSSNRESTAKVVEVVN